MIDTHCHLTFPEFTDRADAELEEARLHGITGAITISTTVPDAERTVALARAHERVWATAGVHPLYADEGPHDWARLVELASDPGCVAWGELGLDQHYDKPPQDIQRRVLEEQLDAISSASSSTGQPALGKPIVIHCRKAFGDLLPVLRASGLPADRFVFHCFTGSADDARSVLDFGAFISFTGVVTYKNAPEVREAAMLVPAGRLMVETDAPFLSPMPKRGERPCRPWMTALTARFLADLRGEPFKAFRTHTDDATRRFFGIEPATPDRAPASDAKAGEHP